MALLIAGLGPVDPIGWGRMSAELAGFAPYRSYDAPGMSARLAAAGVGSSVATEGDLPSSRREGGLAAVGDGFLEDMRGVAEGAIEAYRHTGAAGLYGLRGVYSFVLWDSRQRSMYVGCDVIGLRAPAYCWDGRTFLVSSRALALLRYTRRPWNDGYLAHVLAGTWAIPADATPFHGIRRMRGGELLRVSVEGLEPLRQAQLRFDEVRRRDRDDAAIELGARLDRAVRREAAVSPACVAISGGLDSSTVGATLAVTQPEFSAFSLVAPEGTSGLDSAVERFAAAFPRVRVNRVAVTPGDPGAPPLLVDDPIAGAPAMQPARASLFRACAERGFLRVLDGEGGDELFALAWWSRDLVREWAFAPIAARLLTPPSRARLVAEVAMLPATRTLFRARASLMARRLRDERPWLRAKFWASPSFEEARAATVDYRALGSARDRLSRILASHARYSRAQEMFRLANGIAGASPLLDRDVVELVGSLDASVVLDHDHDKSLLRRAAERRLPASIAWSRKAEPLHDWLVQGFIADSGRVRRCVDLVRASPVLSDWVDAKALLAAVAKARAAPRDGAFAPWLVALLTLAEWVGAVEQRYLAA
jgi:asparagine synthase (glutamine-hydrolysing)